MDIDLAYNCKITGITIEQHLMSVLLVMESTKKDVSHIRDINMIEGICEPIIYDDIDRKCVALKQKVEYLQQERYHSIESRDWDKLLKVHNELKKLNINF